MPPSTTITSSLLKAPANARKAQHKTVRRSKTCPTHRKRIQVCRQVARPIFLKTDSGHFSPCCRYKQKCGLPRLYPSFFPIRKRKTVPTSQIKPVNSRRRRFRQQTNDRDKLRPFRPARFPEYLSHSRIFCSARQQKRLRPLPSPNIGRHITPFGNIHKLWYFFWGRIPWCIRKKASGFYSDNCQTVFTATVLFMHKAKTQNQLFPDTKKAPAKHRSLVQKTLCQIFTSIRELSLPPIRENSPA